MTLRLLLLRHLLRRGPRVRAAALRAALHCGLWLAGVLALVSGAAAAHRVELTPAEQTWVRQHGEVRVVVVKPALEPFYRADGDGPPIGYAIEVMDLMAARAGLRLRYVPADSIAAALAALREGRADMTAILRMSPEREDFIVQPGVLVPVENVFVTRKGAASLDFDAGLSGRRIAVLAQSVDDDRLRREHPGATLLATESPRQAYEAVAAGSADAMLTELHGAVWFLESNGLTSLQVRRIEGAPREAWGPGVRRDLPQLVGIIAKAAETLTAAERADLARRWLPRGSVASFAEGAATLSAAERDWVAKHAGLRAGYDANFAPFTEQRALGGLEGLGADMLRAAAAKVGLRLVAQEGASFADVYRRALQGELNVVVGMARNRERSEAFEFVGPFASAPSVVVTRQVGGVRLVGELADLGAARVGLLAQHFLIPELRSRAPALRLVEFSSQEAVLDALARGELEAAVGNGHVVSKLIQQRHVGQLRVAGLVRDGDSELYFGVPKREPELARVLAQGLAALTPSELADMRQRWLLVRIDTGLQWREVLPWALPVALALVTVLIVLVSANGRLRAAYAHVQSARAAAEAATAARGRFLAYLAHELRGAVGGVAAGARMLRSGSISQAEGQEVLQAIERSAGQASALLETTLASERTLTQGVRLQVEPVALVPWWQETLAPLRLRARGQGLVLEESAPAAPARPRLFDRTRLAQVLTNLVDNAIRFTPGGRVQVRGHWDEARLRLRLEVEDDGPGLSRADRQRLFEPYAQGEAGRRATGGAGLGLAITLEIVSAMGGQISAPERAADARGALFVVELPLPGAPALEPEESEDNPT